MIALISAALLGSVAVIYEDAYHEYDHQLTRDDVAAYAATSIPLNQCEALAARLRAAGGFVVCYPEDRP
jgi:hypothetical protein